MQLVQYLIMGVIGLVAGFLASQLVNRRGAGLVWNIILGIIGAVVGGFIMERLGYGGVTGLNLWSILVATGGAVVVLLIAHAIRKLL